MPNKFKIRKIDEVCRALLDLGFVKIRQKGSHIKFSYDGKKLTVPNHNEISIGTLYSIFKEAGKITENYEKVNNLFLGH